MFLFKLLYQHRKTSLILFLFAFSLLLYGIFVPRLNTGVSVANFDKLAHFSGFFIVFLFGRFATHWFLRWHYWLLPVIAAIVLEYLQGQLVTSRTFSYFDMLANFLGVAAAMLLWLGFIKIEKFEQNRNS